MNTNNEARPEFGDIKELRRLFGIPKTTAYRLEAAGEIRFVRLRQRGCLYGKVLVDLDSVRAYINRCAAENESSRDVAVRN